MRTHTSATYPPLDTLKPVARNIWVVDGPVIRFGMPWPRMPFPTRMTVIRLAGGLFIHSPTPLLPTLKTEIVATGPPRWIVGPNRIHYWWIPDWHTAFPGAEVYLAPRIREQAGARIDFDGHPLVADRGYPWDAEIATLPVGGRYMTEVVFFHRASRTLVLTDLIENFEPGRLGGAMRWLVRLAGALDPDGSMPRDMRTTYPREVLRRAVETMVGWEPERIILAHGRCYARDGTAELRRAFRWLWR
jgi:hypothetical protein